MGEIYLVRHGRTRWNKEEVFRGLADVPLDDWGRRQAEAVGRALQGREMAAVFTSPLSRAAETAAIARQYWGDVPLVEDKRLLDLNYGEWQGLSRAEVEKKYPRLYQTWLEDPGAATFPGGESLAAAEGRCWSLLAEIRDRYADTAVVLFTHRVITKLLLGRVLGTGAAGFWKLRQDTACINLVAVTGAQLVVHYLNDTCHLRELGMGDELDF